MYCSRFWRLECPRWRQQYSPVLVKALLLVHTFLWYHHMVDRARKLFRISYKGYLLIPFMRTLPSWPNHLPAFTPLPLVVRISTYESWRDTNIKTLPVVNIIILYWLFDLNYCLKQRKQKMNYFVQTLYTFCSINLSILISLRARIIINPNYQNYITSKILSYYLHMYSKYLMKNRILKYKDELFER